MKIIKEAKEAENLEELFGRKKKAEPAPPPEKPGINMEWKKYYEMLEAIRKTGVSQYSAGGYLREGTNLPDELIAEIVYSWIENYDKLAAKFDWKN